MSRFFMNEAALVLPDGAVDRSMTNIHLKTASGAKATFVAERLDIEPGQTLREAYTSYIRSLDMRLARFSPIFERESAVDGVPALEIGVTWRNEDGDFLYTRQIHLRLGALWLILAIEGPRDARVELDELFGPIVASVELRSA